eukprot:5053105-Amphidinium_carterae.1
MPVQECTRYSPQLFGGRTPVPRQCVWPSASCAILDTLGALCADVDHNSSKRLLGRSWLSILPSLLPRPGGSVEASDIDSVWRSNTSLPAAMSIWKINLSRARNGGLRLALAAA